MLEVDEDSRLGRELIAGGTRYHAHFVPDEDAVADYYLAACETLDGSRHRAVRDIQLRRAGFESRHNLKYWTRQPYLGFGVDAHSMLLSASPDREAVRFATADSLDKYTAGAPLEKTVVSRATAIEEVFFLGLRLNRGVTLRAAGTVLGSQELEVLLPVVEDLVEQGLLSRTSDDWIRLTSRGRLLSNEVFQAFLAPVETRPGS